MKYGNCLLGAIILMVKLRSWKIRAIKSELSFYMPHFVVSSRDGKTYHFRYVKDVTKGFLSNFIFQGEFARIIIPKGVK